MSILLSDPLNGNICVRKLGERLFKDVAIMMWLFLYERLPYHSAFPLKTEAATFRDKQNSHSCFEQKTDMSLVTSSNIQTQRIQMEGNIQTLLYTVIVSLHKFFTKIKSI